MHTKLALLISAVAAIAALTGCNSLPKDGYLKNAEINTPWGSTKVELLATGAAAKNLTAEERRAFVTPTTPSPSR